ncbi:MAG TPA: SIS domain-containing protein [Candidatus Krumholzibacteria bacterium]|nr:SIS domain-containing protein [Candidatus Krumholzibacteria bacterium]HRX50088.1 SIS domain-containing protein [Candidatus Krumholzibacteria bacterium]
MNHRALQRAADLYARTLADHRAAMERLGAAHLEAVTALAADVLQAWRGGGRLLVAGNGGSAADAQHIVAELVGRFRGERRALPAVALTVNASTLTAVANDYGYDHVFARQVEALGSPGDVLLVISTSGNSPNCVNAAAAARAMGLRVHGFLGGDGGALAGDVHGALIAPSADTPRIQEIHITMGHLLCEILENEAAGEDA